VRFLHECGCPYDQVEIVTEVGKCGLAVLQYVVEVMNIYVPEHAGRNDEQMRSYLRSRETEVSRK
jgi:hypothetical protein